MHTDTQDATTSITGLVLAGGAAHRMRYCDKGLQILNGKTLVAHVLERLQPQVASIIISANRHIEEYAQLGFPVYPDVRFSEDKSELAYAGPLAGLEVGLIHCKTPFLLTVPCDSPFLPMNLAVRLLKALRQEQADVAIACTGEHTHPRAQPVFCLLKTTLLRQLQQYLSDGGRKMDGWYGQLSVARVYFRNEEEFRNINTLEELRACSTKAE
jgi:molybdenum cofactor guanylyltransferase